MLLLRLTAFVFLMSLLTGLALDLALVVVMALVLSNWLSSERYRTVEIRVTVTLKLAARVRSAVFIFIGVIVSTSVIALTRVTMFFGIVVTMFALFSGALLVSRLRFVIAMMGFIQ